MSTFFITYASAIFRCLLHSLKQSNDIVVQALVTMLDVLHTFFCILFVHDALFAKSKTETANLFNDLFCSTLDFGFCSLSRVSFN